MKKRIDHAPAVCPECGLIWRTRRSMSNHRRQVHPEAAGHGTYAMYQVERRSGGPICERCRRANNEYRREYRKRGGAAVERARLGVIADSRAVWKLAAKYPDEFRRLKEHELRSLSK